MNGISTFGLVLCVAASLISTIACDDAKLDGLLTSMAGNVKSKMESDELQSISELTSVVGPLGDPSAVTKGLISYLDRTSGPLERFKEPETAVEFNKLCVEKILKPCGKFNEIMVKEIYAVADEGYNVFEPAELKGASDVSEVNDLMNQLKTCNQIITTQDVCFSAQHNFAEGEPTAPAPAAKPKAKKSLLSRILH